VRAPGEGKGDPAGKTKGGKDRKEGKEGAKADVAEAVKPDADAKTTKAGDK
jgi:hypothetical protein